MEIALVYVFGAVTVIMMILKDSMSHDIYAVKIFKRIAILFGVPFLLGGFVVVAIELMRVQP